jgi:hypothetical protein
VFNKVPDALYTFGNRRFNSFIELTSDDLSVVVKDDSEGCNDNISLSTSERILLIATTSDVAESVKDVRSPCSIPS